MVMDMESLTKQLRSIKKEDLDDDARTKLLLATQSLAQRLESPLEWVQRMAFENPALQMCLKLAHDMGLFEHLGHRDSSPKTTAELADLTKSDADFLKRILRHLAARGVVVELSTPADSYQATELSETLISEASSGIRYSHSTYMPVMQQAPAYLRSIGFVSPKDNRDGIFQNTIGEPGLTKFEWEQKPGNEERKKDFDQLMRYSTKYRKSWMDTFSPEGLAEASKDPNGTLLVDVGGGTGTDVAEFKRRFPKAIGKVILQDLPATIQTAREKNGYLLSENVEFQNHDFFNSEPVHGARIYFLGSVLHDWPDYDAKRILRNIVPAMKRGYSKLLLNEHVLPAVGCRPHLSAIDLTMMAIHAAQERSEDHWRSLLASEGLELVAVHSVPSCLKSVLDVELVPE